MSIACRYVWFDGISVTRIYSSQMEKLVCTTIVNVIDRDSQQKIDGVDFLN